jgi:integrase
MKDMPVNVEAGKATRKRKERGIVRERSWTGADGTKKVCWQADFGTVNGKRKMRSFDVKKDAESWLRKQGLLLVDQGHAGFTLSDSERMDAVKALEALRPVTGLPDNARLETVAKAYADVSDMLKGAASIKSAVAFFLKHKPTTGEQRTVKAAVDEYIKDAEDNGLREKSIQSIRYRLAKLVADKGAQPINEITNKEADNWIGKLALSPMSRKHHRTIAHGLFNFAIDREYYHAENPFQVRKLRRKNHTDEKLPESMPWGDVQKIMSAAVEHEPSMVPALAVGFFAGVRTAELCQLEWSQVDLQARRITVLPHVAKRRRARYVTIEDNLLAWLQAYRQAAGFVAPQGEKWRSRLDTVREKADVTWPHNAMRHSYASNHLVRYGDAARTAFQLGHHADTSMLFEHYRALITKEDAEAYWKIMPAAVPGVVQIPVSQAG